MIPAGVHNGNVLPLRRDPLPEQEGSSFLSRIKYVALAAIISLSTFAFLPWQIAIGVVAGTSLIGLIFAKWCCCCNSGEGGLVPPPGPQIGQNPIHQIVQHILPAQQPNGAQQIHLHHQYLIHPPVNLVGGANHAQQFHVHHQPPQQHIQHPIRPLIALDFPREPADQNPPLPAARPAAAQLGLPQNVRIFEPLREPADQQPAVFIARPPAGPIPQPVHANPARPNLALAPPREPADQQPIVMPTVRSIADSNRQREQANRPPVPVATSIAPQGPVQRPNPLPRPIASSSSRPEQVTRAELYRAERELASPFGIPTPLRPALRENFSGYEQALLASQPQIPEPSRPPLPKNLSGYKQALLASPPIPSAMSFAPSARPSLSLTVPPIPFSRTLAANNSGGQRESI